VYCGQTVGWIKMKLGTQVGLSPGHIMVDGDPAPPPPKGHSPQFLAHICCGQMAGWIRMPLGMEVGLGPIDFVLDGDPAPIPQKGRSPANFRPYLLWPNDWMDQDGIWHGSGPRSGHIVLDASVRPHCARWGPNSSTKGAEPMYIVAKRLYVSE